MGTRTCRAGMVFLALTLIIGFNVRAEKLAINDILINPAPYWNMKVTLVGEVQSVNPEPAGTSRGTYTFIDDSGPNPITIRTGSLPPIGGAFSVTGLVLQVPNLGGGPVINELERTDAGEFSRATLNLLIGLGAVLLILIIVFVVLLLKPKKNSPLETKPDTVIKPGPRTETAIGDGAMPTVAIPMPPADETQLVTNPHAELRVERGIDQDEVFTVSKNSSAIGRAGARINDVVLTDNTVSKAQATLFFDPASGSYSIMNEGTKNPTKVNGEIIGQKAPLTGGELIEMGRTALRFTIL